MSSAIIYIVDVRKLRYFVAVAEEGNVGRAARRLQMSQPPLSQRIRELEGDLGCALFERTPRGMTLTKPGEALLAEARGLLATLDGVRERVRVAALDSQIRVGVIGPAELALSERIVEEFTSDYPDTEVALRQGDFGDPTVGLAAGAVDVAITFAPLSETGLATLAVREYQCFVAVEAADPLAARPSLVRGDLKDHLGIRLPESADALWRAYWELGNSGTGPVVRSVDECLHAVLWQHAVAVVPEQVTSMYPVKGISYVPLSDVSPARLILAWRRSDHSPLVSAYLNAFRSVVAQSTPGPQR